MYDIYPLLMPTWLRASRLFTPDTHEIPDSTIFIRPSFMRPQRLDKTQPMYRIIPRLGTGYAHHGPVAVPVVVDRLAGRRQQRLVDLRVDAPGWSRVAQWLVGWELEADKAASGGEEGGDADGPLGTEVDGEGAEELGRGKFRG